MADLPNCETLLLSLEAGVLHITLNRPDNRNAMSLAMVGELRAVLAAPVDGRLFFAGEATSPNFFSTAHGARDSGERAARELLRSW